MAGASFTVAGRIKDHFIPEFGFLSFSFVALTSIRFNDIVPYTSRPIR